jgi:hypothetical protein
VFTEIALSIGATALIFVLVTAVRLAYFRKHGQVIAATELSATIRGSFKNSPGGAALRIADEHCAERYFIVRIEGRRGDAQRLVIRLEGGGLGSQGLSLARRVAQDRQLSMTYSQSNGTGFVDIDCGMDIDAVLEMAHLILRDIMGLGAEHRLRYMASFRRER